MHIQSYMSFALSRIIKAPAEQIWDGETFEEVVVSQSKTKRSGQPVMHPMTLQPFFESVVSAFFNPPNAVKNLDYAMEWFAMGSTYTETRLMHAMTALECLTDSNLTVEETTFFSQRRFRKIADRVRKTVPAALSATKEPGAPEELETLASQAFLDSLPSKMQDLNRRPIAEKSMVLANRWEVPLEDLLKGGAMARAFSARNNIVHRGWY